MHVQILNRESPVGQYSGEQVHLLIDGHRAVWKMEDTAPHCP
jgi:hypothetical protein